MERFSTLFLALFMGILSHSIIISAVAIPCGENEETTDCEEPCHPTCEIPSRPFCTHYNICLSKCKCKDGFIRERQRGECVSVSSCVPQGVKVGHHDVTCGKNEEHTTCANPCYATCENPIPPGCLLAWCDYGCDCINGFIRETENGPCVNRSSCPA